MWWDFLAAERVLTDADWRCRAEVYTERIDGVMDLIDEFEAEQADRIAEAEAVWRQVETRADQLS